MAYTYSISTNRGKVRLLVGDNISTDYYLDDTEVDFFLTENGSDVYLAASDAANSIAAKVSRQVDKSVGELRVSLSQKAQAFLLLSRLLLHKKSQTLIAYAGGISAGEKDTTQDDSDIVQPAFRRQMMAWDETNTNNNSDDE